MAEAEAFHPLHRGTARCGAGLDVRQRAACSGADGDAVARPGAEQWADAARLCGEPAAGHARGDATLPAEASKGPGADSVGRGRSARVAAASAAGAPLSWSLGASRPVMPALPSHGRFGNDAALPPRDGLP